MAIDSDSIKYEWRFLDGAFNRHLIINGASIESLRNTHFKLVVPPFCGIHSLSCLLPVHLEVPWVSNRARLSRRETVHVSPESHDKGNDPDEKILMRTQLHRSLHGRLAVRLRGVPFSYALLLAADYL